MCLLYRWAEAAPGPSQWEQHWAGIQGLFPPSSRPGRAWMGSLLRSQIPATESLGPELLLSNTHSA